MKCRQIVEHTGADAGLGRGPGIEDLVVPVHCQEFRAFTRDSNEKCLAIDANLEVLIGQAPGETVDGHLLARPIRDAGDDFLNHGHWQIMPCRIEDGKFTMQVRRKAAQKQRTKQKVISMIAE